MHRTLFSVQTNRAYSQSVWGSRTLFAALLLLGGNLAATEPPPAKEKAEGKESPATFRAYLLTIRRKVLLDNERQSVADLESVAQMVRCLVA